MHNPTSGTTRICRNRAGLRFPPVLSLLTFIFLVSSPFERAAAQVPRPSLSGAGAAGLRPGRILVKPRPGADLGALHASLGARVLTTFPRIGRLQVIEIPAGRSAAALIASYRRSDRVEFAEPDFRLHALATPNDPGFIDGSLWGLHNTGQFQGQPDADIDAPEAWDTQSTAAEVVVAVIDSGIRYTHEDLAANMWLNPGETGTDSLGGDKRGNGVDDDGNGYIDDVHGINALAGTGDPVDDNGHGTHVAGTVGAVGNNGVGIVGVAWSVRLMACKFLDAQAQGTVSDAVTCIDYARANGARIVNASWGGYDFESAALQAAVQSLREAGILFVAATGNDASDNDVHPLYPASYTLDNIIAAGATNDRDEWASFSNYGAGTVDLGAPGDIILSTYHLSDSAYQHFRGTSIAAAHVTGACALTWARFPQENQVQIITRLLSTVDPLPSLDQKCVTGGRLNLQASVNSAPVLVTLKASDASASEHGPDPGQFAFIRTGPTNEALTITYALDGAAANGADYHALPESVVVSAGAVSATLTLTPVDDADIESSEAAILTLTANAAYVIGSPNPAAITIADNDPAPFPTVTVIASDSQAAETESSPGTFTFSRTGSAVLPLTVHFNLSGDAIKWDDYRRLEGDMPESITIPAGATSAGLTVHPVDDSLVEGTETILLTLQPDTLYLPGSADEAAVTIEDNDAPPEAPAVSVTASDAEAAEAGPDAGVFTLSRTGDTSAALTVNFSLSGEAGNGVDYQALAGSATIPAGAVSVDIVLTPIDDSLTEADETAELTLWPSAQYQLGAPASAVVSIADNDPPPVPVIVTVTASDENASENGPDPGQFTLTHDGSTAAPVTVRYGLGGTAVNGADYESLPLEVTIPAGVNAATLMVRPIDDLEIEDNETVVLTLAADPGYVVGSPNGATVTIAASDFPTLLPVVTVTAPDPQASETGPDPGVFTLSRTGNTLLPLTVHYQLSGTAIKWDDYRRIEGDMPESFTIPAGANSVNLTVHPVNDSLVEGTETIVLTLSPDLNYQVGSPGSATVAIADNDLAGAGGIPTALKPDLVNWQAYLEDVEITAENGQRTLRFSNTAANTGQGPLEVYGVVQPDGTTFAYQRLSFSDGSHQDYLVGTFSFVGHEDHNHWHFDDFVDYSLRTVTSEGGVGAVVAAATKVSFCLMDSAPYQPGLPGAPQSAVYTCDQQGISIGWADVYLKHLDGQEIDITNLPDDVYWLEAVTDPMNRLIESEDGNNVARIKIQISNTTVTVVP